MLNEEQKRFAIEDARTRQGAIVALILATDQQAIALLSLYVTLGLATTSAMIGGLSSPTFLPPGLILPLLAATIMFLVGAYYCFRTIATATISNPGREPNFWLWAARDDITADAAFAAYLENLQVKYDHNFALNERNAQRAKRAKQMGIAAPLAAILVWVFSACLPLIQALA